MPRWKLVDRSFQENREKENETWTQQEGVIDGRRAERRKRENGGGEEVPGCKKKRPGR